MSGSSRMGSVPTCASTRGQKLGREQDREKGQSCWNCYTCPSSLGTRFPNEPGVGGNTKKATLVFVTIILAKSFSLD